MQVEYEKNRDFRPVSHFIPEAIQDRAIVMERQLEICMQSIEWCNFQ